MPPPDPLAQQLILGLLDATRQSRDLDRRRRRPALLRLLCPRPGAAGVAFGRGAGPDRGFRLWCL